MTVLVGKALADLVTKHAGLPWQRHDPEYTAQTLERMFRGGCTSFEEILPSFSSDDHRVAAVCRLASFAKVPLKIGERDSH
jgi:hypothetical protein